MKTLFLPSAALALLAGMTLSAHAKPTEMQAMQVAQSGSPQNSSIVVAVAARRTARTAASGRRDRPISPARPRRS